MNLRSTAFLLLALLLASTAFVADAIGGRRRRMKGSKSSISSDDAEIEEETVEAAITSDTTFEEMIESSSSEIYHHDTHVDDLPEEEELVLEQEVVEELEHVIHDEDNEAEEEYKDEEAKRSNSHGESEESQTKPKPKPKPKDLKEKHEIEEVAEEIETEEEVMLSSDVPSNAPTLIPTAPSMAPITTPTPDTDELSHLKPILEVMAEDSASDQPSLSPTPVPTVKTRKGLKPILEFIQDRITLEATTTEAEETLSDPPSDSPSDMPSDMPSSSPNSELSEQNTYGVDQMCPEIGFDPYTLPKLKGEGDIFSFSLESFMLRGSYVTFAVSDSCQYTVSDSDAVIARMDHPEQWLAYAAKHLGGTIVDNGARFTGEAVPDEYDIIVSPSESLFRVDIIGAAIAGEFPLAWEAFPTLERAIRFGTMIQNIRKMAPEAFLTSKNNRCGSGPFCMEAGNKACSQDPSTGLLYVRQQGGIGSYQYGDALEWFTVCAVSIGCQSIAGGGEFLYRPEPNVSVEGSRFSFSDEGVLGLPIEYECGSEEVATQLFEFAETAARDPMRPFAIGSPFEREIN